MENSLTLPSGWSKVRLGELFAERNETNKTDLELLSITGTRGIIPRSELEGKDNSNSDKSKYLKVYVGDIAYNTMRMWQGVSALSSYEGIVSPAYTVLTPLEEAFAPYFSYLFKLGAMINIFYRNSQGLVDDQRSLKYHNFARIKVTIPPLPEQKRIAEILIEQDKLIALKEYLIAVKKKQKKWLMQNLLTCKIRLKGYSGEWKYKNYNTIFIHYSTKKNQLSTNEYNTVGRYPIIDQGKEFYCGFSDDYKKVFKCPNGGVIIFGDHTRTIKYSSINFIVGGDGTQLFSGKNSDTKYLYYYLCNLDIPKMGYSRHFQYIKNIKYYLPDAISEQTAIAEQLSAADLEIELLTKELETQKQIKKYLMQQLLTGKIRVTGGEL